MLSDRFTHLLFEQSQEHRQMLGYDLEDQSPRRVHNPKLHLCQVCEDYDPSTGMCDRNGPCECKGASHV
jgi:hypothetical protein